MSWSKYYRLRGLFTRAYYTWKYSILFKMHSGCRIGSPIYITGPVHFTLYTGSHFEMKANSRIHSGHLSNSFGGERKSVITVFKGGHLTLGTQSGISNSTIICADRIIIGSDVLIGGGCCIYDTDFHGISFHTRHESIPKSRPIEIKNGAFIGGYSQILKGVTIGVGSVIAAGSTVTKDIPDYEVWGGNPAKLIRKIEL
jgi:acetyltransferase-like isoleucine patch superfamily enzyme